MGYDRGYILVTVLVVRIPYVIYCIIVCNNGIMVRYMLVEYTVYTILLYFKMLKSVMIVKTVIAFLAGYHVLQAFLKISEDLYLNSYKLTQNVTNKTYKLLMKLFRQYCNVKVNLTKCLKR